MRSCRKHGVVRDDSIITLGGIVGAVGKTRLAQSANFSLEDLDIGWISGCAPRPSTKGTWVDGLLLLRIVDHSFGPNAEECSQISLVQMDHT